MINYMKFTKRTTAPSKDNRYYYKDNAYYKNGYGMPNCTAYAYGRVYELLDYIPSGLYYGNAENWYDNTKNLEKGKTPKLGSIICWSKGKVGFSNDGAGHVAIVEEIKSNGDIITSNSAYQGTNFYIKTYTKESNYYMGENYNFLGFIYLPVNFENKEDKVTDEKIKVGDKVKVKKAINYDNGKSFALYYDKYDVIEIFGNRVVIGIGNIVTSAIDIKNIKRI